MSPIISVEGLSKAYRIGAKDEVPDTILGAAKSIVKAPLKNLQRLRGLDTKGASVNSGTERIENDVLWALRDVNFSVNEGDVIGVIGRNGAGKSTLLKILSRITEPTSGKAVIKGRVSSLLEVGTGFHPELSGRENIYMNGTILGMTKREIDGKFDEIVDFSGVEKFLDTPTKRYSSGMQVRLAFAVAAHLEPEVLVVDEVLAVGDFEFQRKCLKKMEAEAFQGRTIMFVSHNISAVAKLCNRGILIESGTVVEDAETQVCIERYLACQVEPKRSYQFEAQEDQPYVARLDINSHLPESRRTTITDSLKFDVEVRCPKEVRYCRLAVRLFNQIGTRVMTLHTDYQQPDPLRLTKDSVLSCFVNEPRLAPGEYTIEIQLDDGKQTLQLLPSCGVMNIESEDVYGSGKQFPPNTTLFYPDVDWSVTES